jgi:SpoIID/LytB domain protein
MKSGAGAPHSKVREAQPGRLAVLGIAALAAAVSCVSTIARPAPPAAAAKAPAPRPAPAPPAHVPGPAEPAAAHEPPDPSDPLERLYGHKALNFARGAPAVTVRLMEGQKEVTLVPRGRVRLFARGGLNKIIEAPPGAAFTIRLKEFAPGEVGFAVQVGEMRFSEREKLREAQSDWEGRGFSARAVVAGSLYGIAGRVLDNRRHLLFLGAPASEDEAKEVLKDLHRRFGFQGSLVPSLKVRPHGVLQIEDERGATLALAQDLVSVTSPDLLPIWVKAVEHGVGYEWHGRQDRVYRGDLEVVVDRLGGLSVVNTLAMESYLRGIVPSEIFAKAHPEALKAQAVTARGEVLAKIGTRHLTDPYLLCAEQHCQVYAGESGEASQTDAAIAATAGEALFAPDGGPLVNSVYSAVCGGHAETNENVWGGLPDPSLRGRPDLVDAAPSLAGGLTAESLGAFLSAAPVAYCKISSFAKASKFRWERRFTRAEVDEITRPFEVGRVRVLSVARRGVSGRATVLSVSGEEGATQVRGELVIRRLFKNLNSAMFEIEAPQKSHPEHWVFRGGGWGHGVGMCQVGAIGRAEQGQSYREILRHYFNGAEVVRLYSSEAPAAGRGR